MRGLVTCLSSPANGSRECAPDDRLRRAIQYSETPVIESRGCSVLDTPLSRSMTGLSGSPLYTLQSFDHLQHELHRHQYRVIAAHQPAHGKAAEIVDQGYIKRCFKPTVRARGDHTRTHRHFGRKGLDLAAIRKPRAYDAADAAVQPGLCDRALAAESLNRLRKILVRPQPQGVSAAGHLGCGGFRRYRPEQFEIGLGVRLRLEHRPIETERIHLEGLGDNRFLRQDMTAAGASIGFRPQSVAMEERSAVALSERHRSRPEPRDSSGPKSVAVEGGILAGL